MVLITVKYCLMCFATKVIDGNSMFPTLHDGDVIYASEIIPKVTSINRGDIVGITTKVNNNTSRIIKRVIGLPGEHVVLKKGVIYINDQILIEPYIPKDVETYGEFDFQLHEGQYIVLGDNREDSLDSRDKRVGIVKKKEIDFVFLKIKTNMKEEY